ncbi:MAG: D-glycero-beta-D-manno-heptose 1,7-bisphosphate 7-phosphatase [Gammaproteobacteria bacterium]|nr:D-glycero-beta-D-manno-heptose 1,7-bisphosphate 7-phosphatase [Gammaproteobacteria bacterium]
MLVILDRDGVINYDSEDYIKSPEEWVHIPGSLEAIAKLKQSGFKVVVATNQSGIAKGLYSEAILHEIHAKMAQELKRLGVELDGIFYCPHSPQDECSCRKPKPGMFLAIKDQFNEDFKESICVGDSLRDIQAAQRAGSKSVLVLTGNGEKTLQKIEKSTIPVYSDLAEFVSKWLI